jgi:regulator of sigma E protease
LFTPEVILLTILVFFLLVGIHEWGHFYFAKRAGILVREFAIGFGPRVFSYKRGETRYTFRLLPLGGFVRMAGEDPEIIQISPGQTIAVKLEDDQVTTIYLDQLDSRRDVLIGEVEHIDLERSLSVKLQVEGDNFQYAVHPQAMMVARGKDTQIAPLDRQFGGKSVGKRAMAIFAGPMMNFILAFLLFLTYMWMTGIPEHLRMAKIETQSPAEVSGLQEGDLIIAVDGQEIGFDSQRFVDMIASSAGKPMLWTVRRGGEDKVLQITPNDVEGTGKVGVHIGLYTRDASLGEVITGAGNLMWDFTEQIFIGFKMLVTLQFNLDDLGGPVRIVEVTGQAASLGIDRLLLWAALLSLYLGIFNLLPFPALDGSRLLFLGIEAVRGKPVDPNKESMVHFIGFALLMMLMVAVTYNDILRLFKG